MTKENFEKILILFLQASFFALSLSVLRVFMTSEFNHLYLNWNLLLAYIPLIFLYIALFKIKKIKRQYFMILLSFIFIPNAPYLITDFIHITYTSPVYWFDTLMFFVFALLGILMYMTWMFIIFQEYAQKIKQKKFFLINVAISVLVAFGIYLGRELRFNSWDIVLNPISLIKDIFSIIFNPTVYPQFLSFTLALAVFLTLSFYFFKKFFDIIK